MDSEDLEVLDEDADEEVVGDPPADRANHIPDPIQDQIRYLSAPSTEDFCEVYYYGRFAIPLSSLVLLPSPSSLRDREDAHLQMHLLQVHLQLYLVTRAAAIVIATERAPIGRTTLLPDALPCPLGGATHAYAAATAERGSEDKLS